MAPFLIVGEVNGGVARFLSGAAATAGAFFLFLVIFFDARPATAARRFFLFVGITSAGARLAGRGVVIVAQVVIGRGLASAAECVAIFAEPDA